MISAPTVMPPTNDTLRRGRCPQRPASGHKPPLKINPPRLDLKPQGGTSKRGDRSPPFAWSVSRRGVFQGEREIEIPLPLNGVLPPLPTRAKEVAPQSEISSGGLWPLCGPLRTSAPTGVFPPHKIGPPRRAKSPSVTQLPQCYCSVTNAPRPLTSKFPSDIIMQRQGELYMTHVHIHGCWPRTAPCVLKKGLLRSVVPDGAARIFSPDEGGTVGHTFCMAEDANKVRRKKATPGRRKRRKQETPIL